MTQNNKKKVHLVITGGTIDSYYDVDKCTTMPRQSSVIGSFLKDYIRMGSEQVEISEICMKDSRDISQQDIEKVRESILSSPLSRHVVTHGTFTMFTSARLLQALLPEQHGQVIVFTGAMYPLEGFSPNDAGFNLGSATIAAKCLPSGVYVVFNGEIYQPNEMENLH